MCLCLCISTHVILSGLNFPTRSHTSVIMYLSLEHCQIHKALYLQSDPWLRPPSFPSFHCAKRYHTHNVASRKGLLTLPSKWQSLGAKPPRGWGWGCRGGGAYKASW